MYYAFTPNSVFKSLPPFGLRTYLINQYVILRYCSSNLCKEIQPVHSEGDQPWDFFGRNDAKAETPILWPPHVKS